MCCAYTETHTIRHRITTVSTLRKQNYKVSQNKPDCFSELITLLRSVVEKHVVVSEFCPKNCKTYMSVSLNIQMLKVEAEAESKTF